jgi:hypothetical protein
VRISQLAVVAVTKRELAGSLFISLLNSLTVIFAIIAGYSGLSEWWAAVVLWVVPFPFFLVALAYIVIDVAKPNTRKQALLASAILAITATIEWHFRCRGI